MRRFVGRKGFLTLMVLALAIPGLLVSAGTTAPSADAHVSGPPQAGVTISGSWTISTALSYANTSILVEGSVTILSGGSLTLQNVQLSLTEPLALQFGIEVRAGGALTASGSTFESATSTNALWMKADSGATLSLTGGSVLDLGGAAGPMGFVVEAAHASFRGVTFNNYYEGLIISAADVTVDGCTFATTTSGSSSTWVVSTSGTSSGFVMTHSKIVTPSMMGGALDVAASSDIENNTFTLNPHATNPTPVLIGYSGAGGSVNASGTTFAYNVVSGSDVTDYDSSNVVISHNQVLNDGGAEYVHDYGIHAAVVYGSGKGIWINGLQIEHNYVSESTGYGIRVEQNVTNAVIAYNTITNVSTSPTAGTYNGVATYEGIYLIRGVTHTLVYGNLIDNSADQESASISTAGIGLESEVANTTLADNTILNTDIGIWVQGDWNDGPGNIGPSWDNTITGNTLRNTLAPVQTQELTGAIQNYDWANRTTIANNLIEGWNLVPSGGSYYDGLAILQADSFGTIEGNVVASASWGIMFGYFYGAVANASDNVVYGNTFNVTNSVIVNASSSTTGPIVNVLDVLTGPATTSGFPSAELESIGPVRGLGFSESAGKYSAMLQTWNPIYRSVENLTTTIPWAEPDFSVQATGGIGSSLGSAVVTSATSSKVTYSLLATGPLHHTVSLYVPSEHYTAQYTVQSVVGSHSDTFSVNSSQGPASFETNASGSLAVSVQLDSWTATSPNSTVSLELTASTTAGIPASGIVAQVELSEPPQSPAVISVGPTNASGDALFLAVPSGATVSNVTVEGTAYLLVGYSVATSPAGSIELKVSVAPVGSGQNNSTRGPANNTLHFTEQGLASGTVWWVSLNGRETANLSSTGTTITFRLENGSYQYSVGSPSGANASSGAFDLPGAPPTIVVGFTVSGAPPAGSGTGAISVPWMFVALIVDSTVLGVVGALLLDRASRLRSKRTGRISSRFR